MTETEQTRTPVMQRRSTRRLVLGGTIGAGTAALAYAALGGSLDGGAESGDETTLGSPLGSSPEETLAANTKTIESESGRISHLLRRAGFGVSREEFDRYQAMGFDQTISELVNYSDVDDSHAVDLAAQFPIEPSERGTPPIWWLTRIANTKRPLQEKMTFFWHGLLTSQISEVRDPTAMVQQNELFRDQALGSFPEMLMDVSQDPAMMAYLNIHGSSRRAPNENYARELMELFALGEGNYSEDDVREAARAFTGRQVPQTRLEQNVFQLKTPVFRPGLFENGTKTFLGQSGNFRPDDIIGIITEQPASARYIVGRLFSFFVHLDPSDDDIEPFVDIYNSNQRSIGPVVEAMLRSDVFYSGQAYRALVKSPVEYAVGALKAIGAQGSLLEVLGGNGRQREGSRFSSMGQIPFEPPNVAGWASGAAWLNSATIFARLNFINQITGGAPASTPRDRRPGTRIPERSTQQPDLTNLGTAEQALSHFLPMLLDDNVSAETRDLFLKYAGESDTDLTSDTLRRLVYLILGSPEFHLN